MWCQCSVTAAERCHRGWANVLQRNDGLHWVTDRRSDNTHLPGEWQSVPLNFNIISHSMYSVVGEERTPTLRRKRVQTPLRLTIDVYEMHETQQTSAVKSHIIARTLLYAGCLVICNTSRCLKRWCLKSRLKLFLGIIRTRNVISALKHKLRFRKRRITCSRVSAYLFSADGYPLLKTVLKLFIFHVHYSLMH